jgi:hypothetical protein
MSLGKALAQLFRARPADAPAGRIPTVQPDAERDAATAVVPSPVVEDPVSIDDIIRVEEVSDARYFVNALFRRRFGSDAPDYPRHFVAFHRASPSGFTALGYVHYSGYEDCWLCGGMVMDDRAYRRLSSNHRAAIKRSGGVAEIMLRTTFAKLKDAPAIWGYVGDKQAEVVDLRAGFIHTGRKHLMVVWNAELATEERERRIDKIAALGPF